MTTLYKILTRTLVLSSLLLFTAIAHAGVAIIVNPEVPDSNLIESQIAKIYLGKLKSYSNGQTIHAGDLPKRSAIRHDFYKRVVKKSERSMNRYWSKLKYTGKGKPPKQLGSNRDIIKWVARTDGAIGYIDSRYVKLLKKSVKVVLILP